MHIAHPGRIFPVGIFFLNVQVLGELTKNTHDAITLIRDVKFGKLYI